MRHACMLSAALSLLLFLLPLFCVGQVAADSGGEPAAEQESGGGEPAAEEPVPGADEKVTLSVEINGSVQTLTLRDYLMGVVRAEMPAAFAEEALKAQTVAARTYTLYQLRNGSKQHESGADLCDRPACCQAYITEEKARRNWGDKAEENMEKIRAAEDATEGLAVLYDGEPILAAFHSSSAAATEASVAAWSASVPYLQSVESPESEADVPNYVSTVTYTAEELRSAVTAAYPAASLTGGVSGWITGLERDEGGYVSTLSVGGVTLRGVELRRILGLRSACFTVETDGDTVTFRTTGYGHGVGMSQYGANVLAGEGKNFAEILRWYYTGVTLGPYSLPRG